MDIALHPKFSETRLVAPVTRSRWEEAPTRLRWPADGWRALPIGESSSSLTPSEKALPPEIQSSSAVTATYTGVGGALDDAAQKTSSHFGKMVRLRDDGSAPPDNPFVGRPGSKPEIYTLGHRNMLGLAVHPVTGAIWENENGPLGGDEVNILKPGANYGWPLLSDGRQHTPAREYPTRFRAKASRIRVDLGAVDRCLRHDVLYRRSLPELEEQPVRRRSAVRRHSRDRSDAPDRLQ